MTHARSSPDLLRKRSVGFSLISHRAAQNITLVLLWGLAFVSISLPGRMAQAGGGMDMIAALKMLFRVGSLTWVSFLAVYCLNRDQLRDRRVNRLFSPWWLFLGWAFFSVTWSALKSMSIGQAMGLASQLAISWTIVQLFANEDSVRRIMRHLNRILITYSGILLAIYLIAPEMTGLQRTLRLDSADGLVHPTAAGATASLGLLLTVGLYLIRLESGRWLLIGVAIQASILLLAKSRSAMLCAAIVLPMIIVHFGGRRWLGRILVCVSAGLCCLLFIDPGFEFAGASIDSGFEYVRRGQSSQQLAEGSGRVELWTAVMDEVQASPIIGHGYFVTSRSGKLDVWDRPSNQDAHNVVLQVVVTTGLVGLIILSLAMWRWMSATWQVILRPNRFKVLGQLIAFFFIWYALWGTGCTTFMGPVRPESVIFFALLGVVARLHNGIESDRVNEGNHE